MEPSRDRTTFGWEPTGRWRQRMVGFESTLIGSSETEQQPGYMIQIN
jgi:hypothetical protein